MVEISLILYVYNDYEFLQDSINSILSQSFSDLEIICIDDESTDNSLSLLKEYAQKDKRIKINSHKHKGLSASINNTMQSAKGKYLYFINSGTLLEENALSAMYEKIEKEETDFIIANTRNYNKTYDNNYINDKYSINKLVNKVNEKTFNFEENAQLILEMTPTIENKLFSSKFIKENKINFPEDSHFGENIFFFETFLSAKKISCLSEVYVTHLDYYNSIKNKNDAKILDILSLSDKILNLFNKYEKTDDYKNIYNYIFDLNLNGYNRIYEEYKNDYFNKFRTNLIEIFQNEDINDDFIENISDYNRKIFEQILISENFYEFDILRKTFHEKTEYYKLINQKKYLKPYIGD